MYLLKVGRFESRADAAAMQLRLKKDGFAHSSRRIDASLFLLPAAAGLLSFISFPQVNAGLAAWIALAPLALVAARAPSIRPAFAAGVIYGVVLYFPLLHWIPPVIVRYGGISGWLAWLLYALLIVVFAAFPGAVTAATGFSVRRLGARALLAFPVFWVAMELARNYIIFGGFPWLQLGYSQTGALGLIQIADLTGVYGVSFLIAWVNAAAAFAIVERRPHGRAIAPLAAGALLVLAALAYGVGASTAGPPSLRTAPRPSCRETSPSRSRRRCSRGSFARATSNLPVPSLRGTIDLAVLPESPAPTLYQHDAGYRDAMRALASRFRLGLIFNNTRVAGSGPDAQYYNSAYVVSARGDDAGRYDKVHLVPFGEYVPLARVFFFAQSITKDVSAFTPGEAVEPISLEGHSVGLSICFESIFPELIRRSTRLGGELLVNLTNDGWYGATAAPYQHLAMARWRAVENRRFLLRAANSGISAVVAPTGRIEARTALFTREVCVRALRIPNRVDSLHALGRPVRRPVCYHFCFRLARSHCSRRVRDAGGRGRRRPECWTILRERIDRVEAKVRQIRSYL